MGELTADLHSELSTHGEVASRCGLPGVNHGAGFTIDIAAELYGNPR